MDHTSGYIHIAFQSNLNSHQTLQAKAQCAELCRDHGIVSQSFITDNGVSFTSQAFGQHLSQFKQVIKFAGVGTHHHNGVVERSIRIIMEIAHSMMLCTAIHWPDQADPTLWPMAVQYAVYLYNHIPNPSTGLSPSDIFTRTWWEHKRFHDLHVWGSPVYVLNITIADGKKIPRWQPRFKKYHLHGPLSHLCKFCTIGP